MSQPVSRQRTAATARGLAALVVLVGLLAGVPILLLALHANPLPGHLPTLESLSDQARQLLTSPDDGTLLLTAIRIVAWASWAVFAVSVATEAAAAAAGRTAPAIRGFAAVQRPAAYLVAVIVAATTTPAAAAATPVLPAQPAIDAPVAPGPTSTPAGAPPTRGDARTSLYPPVPATGPDGSDHVTGFAGLGPAAPGSAHTGRATARSLPVVRVGRYDSLWRIADRHLGDGRRWTDIYRLNTGRPQPDGSRLTDSDHIEEGWTLLLPADARGTGRPATSHSGEHIVVVRPGDTLSGIAERHLGTTNATQALFEANVGRLQPDGDRLTAPDLVRPGWRLKLPSIRSPRTAPGSTVPTRTQQPHRPSPQVTPPGGPPPRTPPVVPAPRQNDPSSTPSAPPAPSPSRSPSPSPSRTAPSSAQPGTPSPTRPAAPSASSSAVPAPSPSRPSRAPSTPGPGAEQADRAPGGWVQLPSGSILSLGLITIVAGLLELLRRRRRQHRIPGDPSSDPEPSGPHPPAAARAAEEAWLAARRQLTHPDDDPDDDFGDGPERSDERGVHDAEGGLRHRPDGSDSGSGVTDASRHGRGQQHLSVAGDTDTDADDAYFADPATDLSLDRGKTVAATEVFADSVPRLRVRVPAPAPDLPVNSAVTHRRGVSPGQFPAPSLLALIGPPAAAPLAQRAWAGGVGLVGPGAAGTARAITARLLTATGPMGGELITTEAAVADLLPADAAEGFAATPGVTVFGTLRDALAACEAELLARARWLFDDDDLAGHREDPAALPVPAVLLLAHAPKATPDDAPLAAHTDAVLRLGARREFGAVLLGTWPPATLAVSADGTLSEPPEAGDRASSAALSATPVGGATSEGAAPVGRVELLTASDAADLLAGLVPPLREALDVVDPTTLLPPLSTPPTESPAVEQPAERSSGDSGAADTDGPGVGAGVDQFGSSRAADMAEAAEAAVLEVAVFGRVRLLVACDGREVTGVRAKIRNLLALLAVRPDGLTSGQVGDALWPQAPPGRVPGRLSATLALTRRLLRDSAHVAAHPAAPATPGLGVRQAAGTNRLLADFDGDRIDLVPMVDGRYQLHPTFIGSDYRRFTDALAAAAEARRVGNAAARRAALRTVADLYRGCDGEVLGGIDYSWAIPIRERLRRQATDALATLASLLSPPPMTGDRRTDQDGSVQIDDSTRAAPTRSSRTAAFPSAAEDGEDRAPDGETAPDQDRVAAEEALEALEQAIEIDPYNEDLYRQVMRLHAAAGRREDVYQTLRLLEARLLDIDAEPDPATSTLVTQLLRTSPVRPALERRSDRTSSAGRTSRSETSRSETSRSAERG